LKKQKPINEETAHLLSSTKKILEAIKEAHKHPIPVPEGEGRVFGRYLPVSNTTLPHTPEEIQEQFAKIEKDKREYIKRQIERKRETYGELQISPYVDSNDVDDVAMDIQKQIPKDRGRKGGKQPKLLPGILLAVKKLLQDNKRENYSAARLWKYFEDKNRGKKNAFKINGFKIYFDYKNRNSDEERIFQLSKDQTIKSRGRSAFNGYVKEAKKSLK
jgi:hypothetical protein